MTQCSNCTIHRELVAPLEARIAYLTGLLTAKGWTDNHGDGSLMLSPDDVARLIALADRADDPANCVSLNGMTRDEFRAALWIASDQPPAPPAYLSTDVHMSGDLDAVMSAILGIPYDQPPSSRTIVVPEPDPQPSFWDNVRRIAKGDRS
jgi:hypothetical protein